MPIKRTPHRFQAAADPPHRPRLINDVRPQAARNFPTVGMSLPTYRSLPSASASLATTSGAISSRPLAPPVVKRRRSFITKKRVIILIVLLFLLVGGWVGGKFLYNALKVFHGNVFSVLTTTRLKGEDVGRVNILLAGNSADDPEHQGANLTDSIMLVSLDTKNSSGFMLSIPRDLWVNIPGYGHAKINEAYVDGEAGGFSESGYPNGGMGLLEEVVEQNFGININYYALVNYNAFRDAVNAVGGVDYTVQSVDPRGLYDPSIDYTTHGPLVRLTQGVHHLNGQQALDLARARGDAYGSYGFPLADFDRTQHQRELLLDLKSKALSAGVLANPVALGNLFDSIGQNVKTDFTLSEARRLYDIGKKIDNASIQSVSLNNVNGADLLANYTSPAGQSALIPAAGISDFSQIKLFMKRLTTNNPVIRENAKVVVLNGTSVYGLASKTQKALEAKDVNVTAIGDAQSSATTTTVIDLSKGKKPATLTLLKNLYGASVSSTNPYGATYDADLILVVGNDQVQTPSTNQ